MEYAVEETTNEELPKEGEQEAGKQVEGQEEVEKGAVEKLATEIGWRPDGDLDAKAYILKSKDIQTTMRNHIKEQKDQLTGLGTAVKELKTHNERVFKAEVKQLKSELSELKAKKKDAIEEGDVDAVGKLDDEIDGVKEAMVKPVETETGNPEFDDWIKDNDWYAKDQEMAKYADKIADDNAGAPFKRVTALIGRKVKEMFPDKFETKTVPKASPVEGAGKKISASKFTESDLTAGQKSIMRQFIAQGIMTKKDYIKDIQKTQGA